MTSAALMTPRGPANPLRRWIDVVDGIRCGRCSRTLPADDFAPSQAKPGGYCRPCRTEYMRGYWAERPSLPRPCRRCGESFLRWDTYQHPGSAATHCRDCYNYKARLRSNPQAQPGLHSCCGGVMGEGHTGECPRFPSDESTKLKGARWQRLRSRVVAEESRCGVCWLPVDKTLPYNDPHSAVVDHIVPRSRGGAVFSRSNVQLTHRQCNAHKGERMWYRPPLTPLVDLQFVA